MLLYLIEILVLQSMGQHGPMGKKILHITTVHMTSQNQHPYVPSMMNC
jgi:hypothetical protein